jgi:cellulose 1,4-beta-cellobiosidase
VERSDDSGATWNQIASLGGSATSYSSTGLTEGTDYQYRVRAQGAGGYSGYSASADGTTLPATPSSLIATPSSGVIALTWIDNSSGETSYTVQRSTGGGWTTIASLAADSQSFNDVGAVGGLSSAQTYQYRVFCSDDGGNSAFATTSATAV